MAVKSVSAISQRPALPQPFMAQLYATGDFQLFVPWCLLAISKSFDKVGNRCDFPPGWDESVQRLILQVFGMTNLQ